MSENLNGEELTNRKNDSIEKIDMQIKQLQARKKQIEAVQKKKARQEKTRLLVKYGELVEKYLGVVTLEELENVLKQRKQNSL